MRRRHAAAGCLSPGRLRSLVQPLVVAAGSHHAHAGAGGLHAGGAGGARRQAAAGQACFGRARIGVRMSRAGHTAIQLVIERPAGGVARAVGAGVPSQQPLRAVGRSVCRRPAAPLAGGLALPWPARWRIYATVNRNTSKRRVLGAPSGVWPNPTTPSCSPRLWVMADCMAVAASGLLGAPGGERSNSRQVWRARHRRFHPLPGTLGECRVIGARLVGLPRIFANFTRDSSLHAGRPARADAATGRNSSEAPPPGASRKAAQASGRAAARTRAATDRAGAAA